MRNVLLLLPLLLIAQSAHADPEGLRLSPPAPSAPSGPELELGGAKLEIALGATFAAAAVVSVIGEVALAVTAQAAQASNPDCDCVAYVPYLIGVGIDAVVKSALAVGFLADGAKRRADALRFVPSASASSHGGSVGLSLAW
jgi:hypothetical protein